MSDRLPDSLLPSIALLLKEAGALALTPPLDTAALARQPVFVSDRWQDAIAEFLRWSGTTLDSAGDASVYELVLRHGRLGALAVYRAFRDYLIDRGGTIEAARAKLEALRVIPSMAAHWMRLIDWDLDDAERLEPADFRGGQASVRLPAERSDRLKNVAGKDPRASSPHFVEKGVAEKVDELESEDGGPARPKSGDGPRGYFTMGRTIRDLWKNASSEKEGPADVPSRPKPRREEV